ncbi:MAG: ABC1 kinase family protein [Sandaracinaceae bacterium]
MELFLRLVRALWVFGIIFTSYLLVYWLMLLLERYDRDPATGRDVQVLPGWVVGLRERLDRSNARRLKRAMLRLRGVYIKLGQVLSIMGGFLPRVYTKELEALQDAVPPRPFRELTPRFLRDFGEEPAALYARIESSPIAAASLGQVHEAELPDGRRVAVKVLYPGIRDMIRVDLRVLRLALVVYQWFVPVRGLERAHDSLVDLLDRETDYRHEATMMESMAENFAGTKDILIPEVVWERTSRNVLTMTFMEGIKINRVDEMEASDIDPHAVAVRLTECFYEQLFVHRLFHADPHPGNFLVQRGRKRTRPKIVVLDYGAVSEVRDEMVDGMIEILEGIFREDDAALLRGFYRIGFASDVGNRDLLEKTIRAYFQKLLRVKNRTPAAVMQASPRELEALADPEVAREELRELMRSVSYPEGWFYVERASVLMFWLVAQIDPHVDTMRVGFPYIMPLLEERGLWPPPT